MMRLSILCLAFLVSANTLAIPEAVILGATLIDGTGGKPFHNSVVIIKEGRIQSVGGPDTPYSKDSEIIQAEGKYIIPGIMDANVHLFIQISIYGLSHYEGRYEDPIAEAAQIALKNGVTTVFDSWGPRQPLINIRKKIASGEIQGSRVYLAGNIVGYGGPLSHDFLPGAKAIVSKPFYERVNEIWEQGVGPELLWMPAEEVSLKIRDYTKKDIDFIKYGASGHAFKETQFITFSPDAQSAIVNEGHKAGLTVQTHTTSVESLNMAIQAGVDLLQHCDITGPVPMPDSTIKMLDKHQSHCGIFPITERRMQWLLSAITNEEVKLDFQTRDINQRKLIQSGSRLVLSTDGVVLVGVDSGEGMPDDAAAFFGNIDRLTDLGQGHFYWLEAVIEKGMAPMAALQAATANVAEAYGLLDEMGTVEAGKVADLLILNSNPLEDPKNYRDIHLIMQKGVVIDRDKLPENPVITGSP